MGSTSDWDVMSDAAATLAQFGVEFEKRVVSAHRTPDLLVEYAKTGQVARTGGNHRRSRRRCAPARHGGQYDRAPGDRCAGQISSLERAGFPAFDRADARRRAGCDRSDQRAKNAALIAVSILALKDEALAARLEMFRAKQTEDVLKAEL